MISATSFSRPYAGQSARWRQHLGHSRPALGPFVANDDHIPFVNIPGLQRRATYLLRNRTLWPFPSKRVPSLPVIFATAPSGARLPRRIRICPSFLIGFSTDARSSAPPASPAAPADFPPSSRPVTVFCVPSIIPFFQHHFHHRRHAADRVQILHHIFAAGLEIAQQRRLIAHLLPVINRQCEYQTPAPSQSNAAPHWSIHPAQSSAAWH